jgi:hypothetical protein
MKTHVTAFVGPDHDLLHTSLLLTGLCALDRSGAIALRVQRPPAVDRWLVADPVVVCLDVRNATTIRVAIDLRDGEGTAYPIIDRVQWYMKRAYFPVEIERLRRDVGDRMVPFGLNYGCRSTASTVRMMMAVGAPLAAQGRAGLARLRQYLTTPGPHVFEQSPEVQVEPLIIFQTRLWTADEAPASEVEELNQGRVAVIRALKQAFGDRFIGGLVPTAFARAQFPGDLTPHSSHYAEYLALRKRCLIGVYTHGVEHSLAFKLGETFAASQCLVSEPLRIGLPVPLRADENYLLFETPDECVAQCRRLLADAELAARMRRANHEYYRTEVEPAAHVQRVLERLHVAATGGTIERPT